ncbi:MAG TPA: outer membrane lipoprotein-sorting protein [bacterium]|nr:outer membrane lipoprotein-sorting protein [bacterium]
MKSRILLLIAIVTILAFAAMAWAELSAFDIAKKSLELDKAATKTTLYQMTVINKRGKTKVYKFKVWEKDYPDGAKKLVRFLEPSDANGTGLLNFEKIGADDLQWLFLPSLRKSRRLAAGDKDGEFMGSDLFYQDMETMTAEDYTHELLSQAMLDGKQCYIVQSKPKPGISSAYSFTKSWIETGTFIGRKIEMYDKNGKLLKTMKAKKVEQITGIWTITSAEIVTEGKGKAKTKLDMVERQYNSEVPDNYFTTQFLERF